MNKFWPKTNDEELAYAALCHVETRKFGDIPWTLPAKDIFVEVDGYLVIKNPSTPYRKEYI